MVICSFDTQRTFAPSTKRFEADLPVLAWLDPLRPTLIPMDTLP